MARGSLRHLPFQQSLCRCKESQFVSSQGQQECAHSRTDVKKDDHYFVPSGDEKNGFCEVKNQVSGESQPPELIGP
jgi:hypothetical protein